MRLMICTLAALLFSIEALAAGNTPPPERIGQHGRWLVDGQGRVVMLRGGNLLLPGEEQAGSAPNAQTPGLMAAQGFNGVRLVLFFNRLMPKPGAIDKAYLERIAQAVADYRAAGVYVLLDFHQDEYGPSVGVRGFPEWATFSGGHEPKKLPFPAGYFSDPAIQTAFDNFWANHPVPGTGKGVQDFYIQALATVAARFRDESAVFGIDVMNEPFPGTRCNQPDPTRAHCPELEESLLAPFYQRAGAAIAKAAPNLIVFVEPFMLQGALGIPIATPAPAAQWRGLSFHQYGTLAEIRQRGNSYALAGAERTQSAILNTEWGFTNDPVEWSAQARELDDNLIPWLAWARGPFEPLVDSSLSAAGNDNREATLRALARPYPRATAGTPLRLAFDGDSGTLRYRYSVTAPDGRDRAQSLTEIVMPKIQFPNGYTVTVDAKQGRVVSPPNAPVLLLKAAPDAREINITAVRKGELAPLPAPVPTADPYASLQQRPDAKADAGNSGPLSTRSLLGDLLGDPRAHAILEREIPELIHSPQIGMGSQMSLRALQAFAPTLLTNETLDRIDRALAQPEK